MQSVAAQRPFYFDHVTELTDQAMEEFYELNRASLRARRWATAPTTPST